MPLSLPADVWPQVALEDWERYAVRELGELLRLGNLDAATALIGMRDRFFDPALKVLQVELLVRTGHLESARQVAADTLSGLPPDSTEARALGGLLSSLSSPVEGGEANTGAARARGASPGPAQPPPAVVRGLGEALADAFPQVAPLRQMLERYDLAALATIDRAAETHDSGSLAALVCARASEQGLLGPLVLAARRAAASNGRLWGIADTLGLLPRGLSDVRDVQKTILRRRRQHEVRAALTRLEGQVCRVWTTGNGPVFATGFLVAPDLVLTTATMIGDRQQTAGDAGIADLRVTFDAAVTDTEVEMPGRTVAVASEWLVADGGSDLGYLLFRLADPVGHEPGADEGRRGWIPLIARPDPERGTGVAMFRYDARQALVFSTSPSGMRGRDATGMRLQYEIEGDAGGSGSPVFDADLGVVALHVARAGGWLANLSARRLREGTTTDRILSDLRRRGVTLPAGPTTA
jgi:hypothetical protein